MNFRILTGFIAVAGSFVFQFAFLIVQAVWATEVSSPEWKFMPGNQPEAISITQVLSMISHPFFSVRMVY